ncbi:prolipoprotein diacylglyceryl transferase [Asticcacaulis sp. BYS171W]|uniref:Phosphatidylglycerol--prolipoprotein diacylglyceryl transferase n=1 Tax=Asticcacaulis aquaticus TaxID=2984212 RepID=A0ABT5HUT4_9CAUL|nr:prolipoprotein diacylglyceryl transferase [Asticcacaulis aquaticus]MDC7683837.1 prolipoprotein diacylglyceryl transferase [Asticcacaulis aquaticus]
MTLPDINPVIFQIGPVALRWYALAYVAGIALGWYYLTKLIKRETLWPGNRAPVTNENLEDLIIWMALGVILGGRIGYVLFYDLAPILRNPLQFFKVWEGGMSFHGGFIGVCIAGVLYARKHKISPWTLGDMLSIAAPIGLFFGRLANFVNGELWGRTTDVPWGMVFCNKYTAVDAYGRCYAGYLPRHPSQLYEAALEGLLLFGVIFALTHVYKKLKQPGLIMGTFIAGYGLSRIVVETVRNPDAQMYEWLKGPITMGMILSLPMVIAGGWFIWRALKGKTQPTGVWVEPEPVAEKPETKAPDGLA